MRHIPDGLKQEVLSSPYARKCLRQLVLQDHVCQGRLTMEHAMIHAGRQVNEFWALMMICAYAHSVDQFQDGGILDKRINEWLALSRIENWDEVDRKYPRQQWRQRLRYLNSLFGVFKLPELKPGL